MENKNMYKKKYDKYKQKYKKILLHGGEELTQYDSINEDELKKQFDEVINLVEIIKNYTDDNYFSKITNYFSIYQKKRKLEKFEFTTTKKINTIQEVFDKNIINNCIRKYNQINGFDNIVDNQELKQKMEELYNSMKQKFMQEINELYNNYYSYLEKLKNLDYEIKRYKKAKSTPDYNEKIVPQMNKYLNSLKTIHQEINKLTNLHEDEINKINNNINTIINNIINMNEESHLMKKLVQKSLGKINKTFIDSFKDKYPKKVYKSDGSPRNYLHGYIEYELLETDHYTVIIGRYGDDSGGRLFPTKDDEFDWNITIHNKKNKSEYITSYKGDLNWKNFYINFIESYNKMIEIITKQ